MTISATTGLFVATIVITTAIFFHMLNAANQEMLRATDARMMGLRLQSAVGRTALLDPRRSETRDMLRAAENEISGLENAASQSQLDAQAKHDLSGLFAAWHRYDDAVRRPVFDEANPVVARSELAKAYRDIYLGLDRDAGAYVGARQNQVVERQAHFDEVAHFSYLALLLPIAQGLVALVVLSALGGELVRRLHELEVTADAVASGDLSKDVTYRHNDELGRVMRSFAVMLAYLRRVAEVAEAMSNGDLRETVKESSENDVLGRSLNRMIRSLREIVARVHTAANTLSDGATQLRVNSSELSRSSTVQVSGTEQTSVVIEQMASAMVKIDANAQTLGNSVSLVRRESNSLGEAVSGTTDAIGALAVSIRQVAQHVSNATTASNQASRSAMGGENAVTKVVAGMHEISEGMNALRSAITTLDARSKDIGAIVNVIDDIADQTNLLALNAAIEAARAGDAGLGFAVVADEVRKLSDLSANATKQIAHLITTIQGETREAVRVTEEGSHRVADGVRLANDTGAALAEIRDSAQRVAGLLNDVATATDQQATTSEHIVQAAKEMERITSQVLDAVVKIDTATDSVTTATTEQRQGAQQIVHSVDELSRTSISAATATEHVADAAEALTAQAQNLQEVVAIFKLGSRA